MLVNSPSSFRGIIGQSLLCCRIIFGDEFPDNSDNSIFVVTIKIIYKWLHFRFPASACFLRIINSLVLSDVCPVPVLRPSSVPLSISSVTDCNAHSRHRPFNGFGSWKVPVPESVWVRKPLLMDTSIICLMTKRTAHFVRLVCFRVLHLPVYHADHCLEALAVIQPAQHKRCRQGYTRIFGLAAKKDFILPQSVVGGVSGRGDSLPSVSCTAQLSVRALHSP